MTQYDKNIAVTKATSYFNSSYLQSNYLTIKQYGLETAGFIGCLYSWWNTYRKKGKLTYDGFFFQTQKRIKDLIGVSRSKQKTIVDLLKKDGVLEIKKMGTPQKIYYRLNPDILWEIIIKTQDLSKKEGLKSRNPDYEDHETPIIYNNNKVSSKEDTNNNNISSKEDILLSRDKRAKKDFAPLFQPKVPFSNKHYQEESNENPYGKEVESIFAYWNNLGAPLNKHRTNTKLYHKACLRIKRVLKTISDNKIKRAMMVYYETITDPSNKIAYKALIGLSGCKVGLDEFFGFKAETKQRMKLNNISLPFKSWFKFCLDKTIDELNKEFGMFIQDSCPKYSEVFRQLWKEKLSVKEFTTKEENKIRQSGVMFKKFLDENLDAMDENLDSRERQYPDELIKFVFEAINQDVKEDWSKVSVGWSCSKRMYEVRLPDYLKSIGVLKSERKEIEEDEPFCIYDRVE